MIPDEIRLTGGVILREWADDDLPAIVELFDDPAAGRLRPQRAGHP